MKQALTLLFTVAISLSLLKTAGASIVSNGGFESPDIGGRFITYTSTPAGFDCHEQWR